MAWVHTAPVTGTTKDLHGLTWTWCKYCEKMGYHASSTCRRNKPTDTTLRKRKASANVARATDSNKEYKFTDSDSTDDRKPPARK